MNKNENNSSPIIIGLLLSIIGLIGVLIGKVSSGGEESTVPAEPSAFTKLMNYLVENREMLFRISLTVFIAGILITMGVFMYRKFFRY